MLVWPLQREDSKAGMEDTTMDITIMVTLEMVEVVAMAAEAADKVLQTAE